LIESPLFSAKSSASESEKFNAVVAEKRDFCAVDVKEKIIREKCKKKSSVW
jgi:hypothetical protein